MTSYGRSVAHDVVLTAAPAQIAPSVVVVAVVLTHDRPALLVRCMHALLAQERLPDRIVIVDNGSTTPLPDAVARVPDIRVLTLAENRGPAAGYAAGIRAALALGATHVWLMDDDGRPEQPNCLSGLLATAARTGSAITCPLVRNVTDRDRLAFPIRQHGRTRFTAEALDPAPVIEGFAHLFNGALIEAGAFARIGLPNERLFMRGDEVEFLIRARRAALHIVTDIGVGFLHPACDQEVQSDLGWCVLRYGPARTRQALLPVS